MADVKPRIVLTAVNNTQQVFDQVKRGLTSISETAAAMPAKFGTVGTAIAAAFSVASMKGAIDMLDRLDDIAEKTGISVERFSQLRYAGEAAGTSQEQLATGLRKLSKEMAEAVAGNKQAAEAFQALNIQLLDANGKMRAADQVLEDLAATFSGWENGPEKSAWAVQLFGKSGEDLIPVLNLGRQGIRSMSDEAQALGVTFSGEVAKAAAEFNDNLTKIRMASEAAAVSLGGPLVQALAGVSTQFIEARRNGEGFLLMISRLTTQLPEVPAMMQGLPMFRALATAQSIGNALNAPKTTADIQAYVNGLSAAGAGGGRGFVNPPVLPPRLPQAGDNKARSKDDDPTKTGIYRQALKDAEDRQKRRIDEDKAIADMLRDRYVSAQQAASKLLETQRSQLEELRFEASLVGATNHERERAVLIRQNELALQQALIDATEQDRDALRQRNAELLNEQLLALEKKQRLEIHAQVAEEERQAAIQRTRTIADSIEEGILRGSRAGLSIMDILRQELVAQWSRTVLRPLINPIAQAGNDVLGGVFKRGGLDSIMFPGGGYGGGVSLGQVLQGGFGTGNGFGNLDLGGFFADGGRPPVGMASVVGERGPEMFVPDRPGTIIPNHKLGGTTVVVSPTIHIDSRADAAQVEASVRRAIDQSQRELLDTLERQGRL